MIQSLTWVKTKFESLVSDMSRGNIARRKQTSTDLPHVFVSSSQNEYQKPDFLHFCSDTFNDEVATTDSYLIERPGTNITQTFTSFYKTFDKIVNMHPPVITFSKHKIKQFSKPWITKGLRISIQAKS